MLIFILLDTSHREAQSVLCACQQEVKAQAALGGPLWANFGLQYTTSIVCIAAVGRLGQTELAAASMSVSLYGILARTVVLSLTGALDTQASQVCGLSQNNNVSQQVPRVPGRRCSLRACVFE